MCACVVVFLCIYECACVCARVVQSCVLMLIGSVCVCMCVCVCVCACSCVW